MSLDALKAMSGSSAANSGVRGSDYFGSGGVTLNSGLEWETLGLMTAAALIAFIIVKRV